MRFLLPCLLILLIAAPLSAGDSKLTVRESPFLKGEYDIYDRSEKRVGRIRENPFIPGEYRIEGRDGRRKGTITKDSFDRGDWSLETED